MACPHCNEEHPTRAYFCPRQGFPVALPPQADGRPVLDGKYELIRTVGEGAMGMVYVARHLRLSKHFALKLLRPDLMSSSEMTLRFEQEARAASAIGHPHIVEVTDLGQSPEGFLFLVMEMLTGRTLAEALEDEGRLEMPRAIDITCQMLDGLEAAHAHRVVHRDLKPENVFLCSRFDREDFVKVLDFGIARCFDDPHALRLTQTGLVMGTPHYMAPEQARGLEADHRVDVFASGVMLYEMITGEQPFVGPNYNAVMMAVVKGQFPPPRELMPEVPEPLEEAILTAMAPDPRRRYQTAGEFRSALEALIEEIPVDAGVPPLPHVRERAASTPVLPGTAADGGRTSSSMGDPAQTLRRAVPPVPAPVEWEFPAARSLEILPLDAPAGRARGGSGPPPLLPDLEPAPGPAMMAGPPPLLPDLGPPGPASGPASTGTPLSPPPLLPDVGLEAPTAPRRPTNVAADMPTAESGPDLQIDDRQSGSWSRSARAERQLGVRGPTTAGVWVPPPRRFEWRRHLGWILAVVLVAALWRPALSLYEYLFAAPVPAAPDPGGASIPIMLDLKPADAIMLLDGAPVRQTPLAVPRDGRTRRLRFTAPGYDPEEVVFVADEPQRFTIELRPIGRPRRH